MKRNSGTVKSLMASLYGAAALAGVPSMNTAYADQLQRPSYSFAQTQRENPEYEMPVSAVQTHTKAAAQQMPKRSSKYKTDFLKALAVAAAGSYLLDSADRALSRKGMPIDSTARLAVNSLATLPGLYLHEYAHHATAYELYPENFTEPDPFAFNGINWKNTASTLATGVLTGKLTGMPIPVPMGYVGNDKFRPSAEYSTFVDFLYGNNEPEKLRQTYLAGPMSNVVLGSVVPSTFSGQISNCMSIENLMPYNLMSLAGIKSDGYNIFNSPAKKALATAATGYAYLSAMPQESAALSAYAAQSINGESSDGLGFAITPSNPQSDGKTYWAVWKGHF